MKRRRQIRPKTERTGASPRFAWFSQDRRLAPNGTYIGYHPPLRGGSRGTSGEGGIAVKRRFFITLPGRYRVRPSRKREGEVSAIGLAPCRSRRNNRREGLTLLEVVLSLAIFVGSMAVLSQLVSTGHRAAINSRLQTQAIIRAEAQMNEVIADPSLMVSASGMPFAEEYNPDAPGQWNWSLNVGAWEQNANLLQLELTVVHSKSDGIVNAHYTLRRYVRDPQAVLESQTTTTTEEEALF